MARHAITIVDFPTERQRTARRLAQVDAAALPGHGRQEAEGTLARAKGAHEVILAEVTTSPAFAAEPTHGVMGPSLQ